MDIKTVAVIGGGTMGNGIAHVCAQNGRNVFLIEVADAPLTKAVATIDKNLARQVEKGKLTEEDRQGQRASYTNTGSVVTLSAPGGDPAVDAMVLSTSNSGTTVP
ncbi:MAG: 3-hydroxyacyl-CoA dehydrogenase NAD-binding domain-containing protein, partial [Calditrichota bacterium]